MIGGWCPPMRVKWSQRWSFASCRSSVAATCPPVVELFPHFEVEKGLGRDDAVERADAVREVEQFGAAGGDDLDDDVELARGDDDVVRLRPLRDFVGDAARRAGGLDADERLLEAEPERVRNADDLQNPVLCETSVPCANGRLRDADARRDAAKGLAAVALQGLDDLAIDLVDSKERGDRSALVTAHPAGLLHHFYAFRQRRPRRTSLCGNAVPSRGPSRREEA